MNKENKHIIKINKAPLSKEQISKKQDFGRILKNHQKLTKRPVYNQKKFYFALFLIVIIAFLLYLSEKEEAEKENIKVETTR